MNRVIILLAVIVLALCIVVFVVFLTIRKSALPQYGNGISSESVNTVSGSVYHKNGKKIRLGAHVQLCGIACYYSKPSLSGSFQFENIVDGQYMLYAEYKDCASTPVDLILTAQNTIVIDYPLITDQCT